MNINLRTLQTSDCPLLEVMLSRIEVFSAEDRTLAMELVQVVLTQPCQHDYIFLIAADEVDTPIGFACFGPTPLTLGTFDLYWIAVDPACAGQGLGTRLLNAMEGQIRAAGGRMVVIETSSAGTYARTCQFYLNNGYILAERLQDFYQDGEDRITYVKRLC